MPDKNQSLLPSKYRSRLVILLLAFTVAFLAIGFSIGASDLSSQHSFQLSSPLAGLIVIHPVLMVFGVIGGLLIAEKIELMKNFVVLRGLSMSLLIVPLTISGIIIYSTGLLLPSLLVTYAGTFLIALVGFLFMWFMISSRSHGTRDAKIIMGSSLLALSLSAIAESYLNALNSSTVALLLLSFPIIYVLGERIELGQMRGIKRRSVLFLESSTVAVPFMLFIATLVGESNTSWLLFNLPLILLILMCAVTALHDPSIRISKLGGTLQSFMRFGIRSSYVWLFLGLILYAVQHDIAKGFMDPATHSIAIGFLGTFIISHSPIIFPLILKIRANTERVTRLPLYALNAAAALRVGGDLVSRFFGFGNILVFSSIWVLLLAILLFLGNIARIRVPFKENAKAVPE